MMHHKTIDTLIDIKEIYLEPEIKNYLRGNEILAKYPDTKIIEVPSHWKIPELHGLASQGRRCIMEAGPAGSKI